jgi:hypothetical protein
MGRPNLLSPRRTDSAETLSAVEEKAPLANLCSRLIVNEHPQDPSTLELWAYALPTSASAPAPLPARLYGVRNSAFHGGVG